MTRLLGELTLEYVTYTAGHGRHSQSSNPHPLPSYSFHVPYLWSLPNKSSQAIVNALTFSKTVASADSDSDKETTDIGCKHSQIKLSAQLTSRKDDIIAHPSTTSNETMGIYFFITEKRR
ncbi:hypothetical protein AVEN_157684-1 [Araneus ventricosus]|uniref:Uncharacterized protein n=1 Tax=Araneus ventricosus TaxID=182803 RepID=A0A4Y2J3C1_ARAVE|nr:hypothetical protein AVEN_157684-1 [Araneus ventricosus]